MGGRVAEKIVFGHLNSGAANDLEQATMIARRMVREWGMSDAVGPMAWSGHQQVFLGEDLMTQGREYSDDTAKMIDEEIVPHPPRAGGAGVRAADQAPPGLDLVAEALLEQETIDGGEVARIVHESLGEGPTDDATSPRDDVPPTTPLPKSTPARRQLTAVRSGGRGAVPGWIQDGALRRRPPTGRSPTSGRRSWP